MTGNARSLPGQPLRVGVAGVHGHGRGHVDAVLAAMDGGVDAAPGAPLRLAAVADPRGPGAVPTDVLAYADAGDMIDEAELDLVILSTPIPTHVALAERALESGAHVLLEKPPVTSVADHEHLLEVCARTRRSVQVGFQSLGSAGIPAVRETAASGIIGEVLHVGAVGAWSRSEEYWTRAGWAGHRVRDGVVVADGAATNPLAHALASALSVAGAAAPSDVESVSIDMHRANDIATDDTSSLVARLRNGGIIAAGLAVTAERRNEPYVLVRGTRGHLVYYYTLDVLAVYRDGAPLPRTYEFARHSLLENMVAHIRSGSDLLVPLAETGAFTRILELIVDSPAPQRLPESAFVRLLRGTETFRIVRGVEEAVENVAWHAKTFTELGAFSA